MGWIAICRNAECGWVVREEVVAQAVCSKWRHEWAEPQHRVVVVDASEREALRSVYAEREVGDGARSADGSVAQAPRTHPRAFRWS